MKPVFCFGLGLFFLCPAASSSSDTKGMTWEKMEINENLRDFCGDCRLR